MSVGAFTTVDREFCGNSNSRADYRSMVANWPLQSLAVDDEVSQQRAKGPDGLLQLCLRRKGASKLGAAESEAARTAARESRSLPGLLCLVQPGRLDPGVSIKPYVFTAADRDCRSTIHTL